jgi:hypothetical protein
MSLSHGPFHPDELGGPDAGASSADLADATAAARKLETALSAEGIHPSPEFVTRVMESLASEPAPRPGGFLAGLLARPSLGAFLGSIRGAWAVASGGAGRPMAARGMAMAYVLAVVLIGASLTGVAAIGTAGALGLLDDASPSFVEPSPSPSPSPSPIPSPSPTLAPTPSTPDPSGSPEPSESAEPSGSLKPDATPSSGVPTASPSASDDSGSSPDPSDSADPSDTPKPSETPH